MVSLLSGAIIVNVLVNNLILVPAAPKPALESFLTEGDIVVTQNLKELITETSGKRKRRSAVKDKIKLWENGRVPYTMAPNLHREARKTVLKAIREFERQTCIRFTPRVNEKDYVEFERNIGCFSAIGRQGGHQKVSVGDGCEYKGIIIHEMMHTLGFFHEHTRPDRDQHIMVLWWNIESGKERNFESYSHDVVDTQGEEYDYDSIMHYKNKDYSYNGDNTIQSLQDPRRQLGQMEHFSKLDLKKIQKIYKCHKSSFKTKRKKKKDQCKDHFDACKQFAKLNGSCRRFKKFMVRICKKSCKFCDESTSEKKQMSVFS